MDGMGKDPYKPIRILWFMSVLLPLLRCVLGETYKVGNGFACGDFTPLQVA